MSRVETLERPRSVETPKTEKIPSLSLYDVIDSLPSPELVSVAEHELNHALVAMLNGAYVIDLSVVPDGDSLGRTTVGGLISHELAKIISAAGGVDTPSGFARGFGSDKFKVDVIHHYHGGHSWDSARSQASVILSSIPFEERRIASIIIASKKEVTGSEIPSIMRMARLIVNNGKETKTDSVILVPQPEREFKEKTIIDLLPGNMQRVRYVIAGVIKKEELICGVCFRINGHDEKCPNEKLANTEAQKKTESQKEINKPKNIELARKGMIFSRFNMQELSIAA